MRLPAAGLVLVLLLPPAIAQAQAAAPRRVTIGSGSGHLSYPNAQATLKLAPGDTLHISAGIYDGLALGNLAGTAAAPITVTCDPGAVFTARTPQPNDFPNIAHVRFENFRYEKYKSNCMRITGRSHDLVFKGFRITDSNGYCFHVYDAAKVFDGTRESTFHNFRWEGCVFDGKVNGAAISNQDYQPASNLKSLALDFEIVGCTFRRFDNSEQAFPCIGLDRCFNLQVRGCNFSDIGMAESPIGHNACIVGSGYFKVYNNTFARHWANDVRLFPMKLNALGYNGPDAVGRYYNNISMEKRKYPAYEQNRVPPAEIEKSAGRLSPTTSEICFNTLYRSRRAAASKDPYCAQLVDVYSPGVTIRHNLIIEPDCDTPFDPKTNYVYHLGAGPQPDVVAENNLVFRTLAEAGLADAVKFVPLATSPARDAATGRVAYIAKDHFGNDRYVGAAADVGAVERQEVGR